jgi:hypothetical protein
VSVPEGVLFKPASLSVAQDWLSPRITFATQNLRLSLDPPPLQFVGGLRGYQLPHHHRRLRSGTAPPAARAALTALERKMPMSLCAHSRANSEFCGTSALSTTMLHMLLDVVHSRSIKQT